MPERIVTDERERKHWLRAAQLAQIAMGKTKATRGHSPEWEADLDPLAWWCLTEAIHDRRSRNEHRTSLPLDR